MPDTPLIESILKRDRCVVGVCLLLITALSWWYLVDMAQDMASMDMPSMESAEPMSDAAPMAMDSMTEGSSSKVSMSMTGMPQWDMGYFVMMFLMWSIMMVGMMTPSAAPMILVYSGLSRNREKAAPYLSTGAFLTGYLLIWTAFSLAATLLQWGLDEAALLSPMMVSTSPYLGAGLLIGAGVFQFTPWKSACLAYCRNPLQFFMQHWRKGKVGALRMGVEHGLFCLGCCWILMGLLFFGGVMNLVWIALITAFVLLEKVAPLGQQGGKITGVAMVLGGIAMLIIR
jgi:predicted metal-binding membrane protein